MFVFVFVPVRCELGQVVMAGGGGGSCGEQEGQKTLDRASASALVRIVMGGLNVHAEQVGGGALRARGVGRPRGRRLCARACARACAGGWLRTCACARACARATIMYSIDARLLRGARRCCCARVCVRARDAGRVMCHVSRAAHSLRSTLTRRST